MGFADQTLNAYEANLVALYKMDEASGAIVDSVSGAPADSTLGDPTYSQAGKVGDAINFDGAGDAFIVNVRSDMPTGDFTIALWVKRADASYVLSIDKPAPQNYNLQITAADTIWTHETPLPQVEKAKTNNVPAVGTWTHVALTRSSGNHLFYLDGAVKVMSVDINDATGLGDCRIVVGWQTGGGVDYYNGDLDQLVIWNTALSAGALSALYNGGSGAYYFCGHGEGLAPRVAIGGRIRHPGRVYHVADNEIRAGLTNEWPPQFAPQVVPARRCRHVARSRLIAPKLLDFQRRHLDGRGRYRIFNDAEYRFYRTNWPFAPAEGDTPFATSASLPDTPATTFGNGIWHISVSYFNGVLDSGFLPLSPGGETYLRLDIAGDVEINSPPEGVLDFRLEQRADGVVRVIALYHEQSAARATQWAINWVASDEALLMLDMDDPNLTIDMPGSGLAILSYDLPAQVDGKYVHVLIQTRRLEATYVYSDVRDQDVLRIPATTDGPAVSLDAEAWPGGLTDEV